MYLTVNLLMTRNNKKENQKYLYQNQYTKFNMKETNCIISAESWIKNEEIVCDVERRLLETLNCLICFCRLF